MDMVPFGRTGLKVSVAGLGCGGNSRLGLGQGKSEADAVRLIRAAHDLGVNFLDTAQAYGTEGAVGAAVAEIGRDKVVISTKSLIRKGDALISPADLRANLEASLGLLKTDFVDVYNLHAVKPADYAHAEAEMLPELIKAREAGKIHHIGITETSPHDPRQVMMQEALKNPVWEAAMFAIHMLHQGARRDVLPMTQANGVGTMAMFVVRNIFSQPDVLVDNVKALIAKGQLDASVGDDPEPLDFLIHESGARNLTDAAYRFVRHTPGIDVTLFGTGSVAHLEANIASILRPPLPAADIARLHTLFGHLEGVGLDLPGPLSRG